MAGALLGVAGLIFLVEKSAGAGTTMHVRAFTVFAVSVVLLYSSSALYHLAWVNPETRKTLRRIDHTMIFALIAGTYTPYCLLALRETIGVKLLIIVWSFAIAGLLLSIFWIDAPRWLKTGIYLVMGWFIVLAIMPLKHALTPAGFYWLVAGGASYSIGAVVYAVKWPDPFPPHFGFHEIWHLFVLGGTAAHFVSVATLLP